MADDQLTDILAEIRFRQRIAHASPKSMAESGADVPRLLTALDKVLALHRNETRTLHGIACLPHQRARDSLVPARGCYECRQDVSTEVCPECRDEVGDPVPFADCRVREAILAALTGKDAADGH